MAAKASNSNVPKTWPGAFEIFSASKRVVLFNTQTMIILFLIVLLTGLLGSRDGNEANLLTFVANIASIAASIAITVAAFAGLRSQKINVQDAFQPVFTMTFLKYIAAILLMGLALVVSFLLLIVPFFFVLPRITMAPYLVIDKGFGPIRAIQESWAMTQGHAGKIWGVLGVTLLFSVLIIVLVGIYLLFIYQAALVILYAYILSKQKATAKSE